MGSVMVLCDVQIVATDGLGDSFLVVISTKARKYDLLGFGYSTGVNDLHISIPIFQILSWPNYNAILAIL